VPVTLDGRRVIVSNMAACRNPASRRRVAYNATIIREEGGRDNGIGVSVGETFVLLEPPT
jgi:hypothetical protein